MTDQIVTKPERSANNTNTRLSYDCLVSATKSFVHNFASLTEEERTEFKSLATYVKQLEKCLPSKNRIVSRPVKNVVKVEQVASSSPVVAAPVAIEEKVVEPSKGKKAKAEVSPTAKAVAAVAVPVTEPVVATDASKAVKKVASKSK